MTPDQIALVQGSFRAVLPMAPQAATLFYTRLFELDPSLKPLFAGTDLESQGQKLMAALGSVVAALPNRDSMRTALEAMAVRHVRYGVRPEHYTTVGRALLSTLADALAESWTPATFAAWAAAYGWVSRTMIAAAAPAPTPVPA